MKITAIKRAKGSRSVHVYLGEDRYALATEVVMRAGLGVGTDLSPEQLADLQKADVVWRCKDTALAMLARSPKSSKQLRDRLYQRGMPAPVIETCLQNLASSGLVDDDAYAAAFARESLRRRPTGRARLISELRARGVDAGVAQRAASEALAEVGASEMTIARQALEQLRPRRGEERERFRRRMAGFLGRRGFSSETISSILEESDPGV
jgi:regulatory protein